MRSHPEPQTETEPTALHRRRKRAGDHALPTTIPVVIAEVDERDRVSVQVDGVLFTPEPIGRAAFGSLLDEILRQRGTTLRVQVHEADGTSYTDLLTPPTRVEQDAVHAAPRTADAAVAAGSALLEVTGAGFVPGEEVAVAPVLVHASARGDGTMRSLVELDGPVAELLVYGRVSGTIHVVRAHS